MSAPSAGAQLLLLCALTLGAHAGGLAGGFVYDDHRFVADNPALLTVTPWQALTDAATHTSDRDRDVYRPLRTLGHAFDLRRWGADPFGFHLHSLLAHVAAVLAAFWALRRLLPGAGPWPPLFGATFLAVHPLGVEVVAWISSRGDLYATLFGLLALAAARSPTPIVALLSGVAAMAATLGKESAVVLPVIAWLAGRLLGKPRPLATVAMAAGVLVAFGLRQLALDGASPVQTAPHGGSWLAQVGWAFYGLTRTLGHLLAPVGLSVEYAQDEWARGPTIWLRPATWVGIGLAASPVLLARRSRTAAFLAAWALLAYLPSSSLLVTLRSLVNDRGTYPMLAPVGALSGLALMRWPRLGALVLAVVAILGLAASRERTAAFASDEALWLAVLEVNPGSVSAHMGLAAALPDARGQHLRDAVRVAVPGSKPAAMALARLGDHLLRVEHDAEAAVPVLVRALDGLRHWSHIERAEVDEPATAGTLAEALVELGHWDQGDALLVDAAQRDVRPAPLLVKLAVLRQLRSQGTEDAAVRSEAARQARQALDAAVAAEADHPLVHAVRAWFDGRATRPSEAALSRP